MSWKKRVTESVEFLTKYTDDVDGCVDLVVVGDLRQAAELLVIVNDELERFRGALEKIRDDPRQSYERPTRHPLDTRDIRSGLDSPYKIGVTGGHKCAADIARAALEPKT